ncbi:FAD-dependent thymidylate synthase [Acanthopleuribacter pedis]|uniref:FAD-dependent thymidylate synthase n=1 Tax=Acanthopleuribacter pedis TaxID=442870 RepID=A0A8J7Q7B7_9BACT|nr:FAD-dependent thymidylate synthase [Acanthopleuribacter pedis]MBO1319651.1 FAD-dependent thymidylate synthase [Acanthopleuribacter pedis]
MEHPNDETRRQEEALLARYVTNTDKPVFAIKNLHGIVGAVMARYSRAETGLRETLLREFVKEDKLQMRKADKLIERVLIAYGDDSVGELEGAHLSFEGISMLATKVIEHRRIGGSPIEQSTRYVRYDHKDPEQGYLYVTPEATLNTPHHAVYRRHMDIIFDAYTAMWQPLYEALQEKKPLESAEYDLGEMGARWSELQSDKARRAFKRTYNNDLKTKVCDVLRPFLPLATRANMGLFGNGRFFQHLISKMLTANLPEAVQLGEAAFAELSQVIPHYVKRAKASDYAIRNRDAMADLAGDLFADLQRTPSDSGIRLVEVDFAWIHEQTQGGGDLRGAWRQAADLSMLTAMLFPYVRCDFETLRRRVAGLTPDPLKRIWDTYYGNRGTRRDRPERGIEHGQNHLFDCVTEWAVYKDLMRHRMGTIQVQPLVPDLGFEMPLEIEAAGLGEHAARALEASEALYAYLDQHLPREREYAFLQGHKMRWSVEMNDRALMHMLELRTTPQGHPNYRAACQTMHRLLGEVYPERAQRMAFVNHEDVFWSRSDSEARQRVKESSMDGEG